MNDIELKIVSTIKIQTIVDGKKTTRRRFNFDVELPEDLEELVSSHCADVWNEVRAELRTPEEWVCLINRHANSHQLRGWAASIIWFKYGGNDDNVLYRLTKSYDHRKCKVKFSTVTEVLERMGCPRFVSEDAAIREQDRRKELKKYSNKTIKLEVKS